MRLSPFGPPAVLLAVALSACGMQAPATRTDAPVLSTTLLPTSVTSLGGETGSGPGSTASTVVPTTAAPTSVRASTTSTPRTTVGTGAAAGVTGTVLFGPVCPVERVPPDPRCAPRAGAASLRLLRPDASVAAQGSGGADGHFRVLAPPGRYTVVAAPVAPAPGRGCQADPPEVTVVAGSFASVAVSCDTGLR